MKAHICIGGPLDGEFATGADFYGGYEKTDGRNDYKKPVAGMYAHMKDEYHQFNTAHRSGTTIRWKAEGGKIKRWECHVVWLHTSLLQPAISPKDR